MILVKVMIYGKIQGRHQDSSLSRCAVNKVQYEYVGSEDNAEPGFHAPVADGLRE